MKEGDGSSGETLKQDEEEEEEEEEEKEEKEVAGKAAAATTDISSAGRPTHNSRPSKAA